MTHTVIGIIIAAALFAVFGLLPHRSTCNGHCSGCTGGSCDRWKEGDHHAV